jgi:hypothetical protein
MVKIPRRVANYGLAEARPEDAKAGRAGHSALLDLTQKPGGKQRIQS